MYTNTKITRYLPTNKRDLKKLKEDFDMIDGYFANVSNYISTDIVITDFSQSTHHALQSRLQKILSENLLRSLSLKDAAVTCINQGNFPGFYACLKSFLEVPAVLGYIGYKLSRVSDDSELIQAIVPLWLGNKDGGGLSIVKVDAINIMTLFDKTEKLLKEQYGMTDKIISSFYSNICNFGHPNFDSFLSVGVLRSNGTWEAKDSSDGFKSELHGFYLNPFVSGIVVTQLLTKYLFLHSRINEFELVESRRFFSSSS